MKDNQNEKRDKDQDLINDINSVAKEIESTDGNENVDDPKRPPRGGRHEGNSVEDGGQDTGSSAGSH